MVRPEDRTPEAIRTALEELLQSEGWAILSEMARARFGEAAQIAEIDTAMASLSPADTVGQIAIVTQIRAASHAATAVLDMPASKLRALQETPVARTFDRFRRSPRHA